MANALPYLFGAALLATVGVLFTGVITFALGPRFSARFGNRLMAARVICQGIAVAVFALMVLLHAA